MKLRRLLICVVTIAVVLGIAINNFASYAAEEKLYVGLKIPNIREGGLGYRT